MAQATDRSPEPGGPLILAAWEGHDRKAGRLISELAASGAGDPRGPPRHLCESEGQREVDQEA